MSQVTGPEAERRTRSTTSRPFVPTPEPLRPAVMHVAVFARPLDAEQQVYWSALLKSIESEINGRASVVDISPIKNGLVIQVRQTRDYPFGREHPTEILGEVIQRLRRSPEFSPVVESGFTTNRAL